MKTPDHDVPDDVPLARLARRISACRRCPRLVRYLSEAKAKWPDHRCKPVPGWGDVKAKVVIVGLAPGMHGANKTGRMFSFDSSGRWLYGELHRQGLSNRPVSGLPGDGLRLRRTWITGAARCAPPGNRPTPAELTACRPYLEEELRVLGSARVILALGRIAHEAVLRILALRPRDFPFGHGALHALPLDNKIPRVFRYHRVLIDSYHPSRQNTQTGRLTQAMWRKVFDRVRREMAGRP